MAPQVVNFSPALLSVLPIGPGTIELPADGTSQAGGVGSRDNPYKIVGAPGNFIVLLDQPANPTFQLYLSVHQKTPAKADADAQVVPLVPGAPFRIASGTERIHLWHNGNAPAGQTFKVYIGNGTELDVKGTPDVPQYVRPQPVNGGATGTPLVLNEAAGVQTVSLDQLNRDFYYLRFSLRGSAPVHVSAFGLATTDMPLLDPDPSQLYVEPNIVGNTFSFLWGGTAGDGTETTVHYQILGRQS